MIRIELTHAARTDLTSIGAWLAQRSPTAARKTIIELRKRLQMLAETPKMGRQQDDLAPGLIGLVSIPYLVLYRFEGDVVTVVRIVDGRRDLTTLFQT